MIQLIKLIHMIQMILLGYFWDTFGMLVGYFVNAFLILYGYFLDTFWILLGTCWYFFFCTFGYFWVLFGTFGTLKYFWYFLLSEDLGLGRPKNGCDGWKWLNMIENSWIYFKHSMLCLKNHWMHKFIQIEHDFFKY